MGSYHVVFNINRSSDLRYLAVAVRSLVRHFVEPASLVIHILWSQLPMIDWSRLEQSWGDLDCQLCLHPMDEIFAERATLPGFGYWNWLWHSEVLNSEIDYVLCLDCDVIVYGDVSSLWTLDLTDKIAAAVFDPGSRVHDCTKSLSARAEELGLSFDGMGPYYNGGVYFVNLHQWHKMRVLARLEEMFSGRYESLRFHDQDALNLLFVELIVPLSPEWNLLESLKLYEEWDFQLYRKLGDSEEYFQATIRHFSGESKPDSRFVGWEQQMDFYHYLDQTVWRGWRSKTHQAWWSQPVAHLIDFHYIVLRGYKQRALSDPGERMTKVLRRAPYIPLLYPLLFVYRASLWLRNRIGSCSEEAKAKVD